MMTIHIKRPAVDYRSGIRSYKDAVPGSLADKAPYVDHGTGLIDPARYRDPAVAVVEWEKLWTKVWTFAGFAADIPNAGDWFKYDLGAESFVVVRGDDLKIRAFYNVCPHRGNQLVRTDFGTALDCFRCAFHSWEFDTQGQLRTVKEAETFRKEALSFATGLTEVRCDVWAGFVFINMDSHCEDLQEFLGILPEHLDRFRLDRMRVLEDFIVPVDCNWKTLEEAFLEFYHGDTVHPELAACMETYHCQYDLYPRGVSRMILPYGYAPDKLDDPAIVNDMLKSALRQYKGNPDDWAGLKGYEYKKALVDAKRKLGRTSGWDHFEQLTDDQLVDDWNYSFFPNVTLNIMGENCLVQVFTPHETDPMKSYWRSVMINLPSEDPTFAPIAISSMGQNKFGDKGWDGTPRPPIVRTSNYEETGFILAQDGVLVPAVQRGINSRAFKGAILSEQELRIRHYLAEIDRYLDA